MKKAAQIALFKSVLAQVDALNATINAAKEAGVCFSFSGLGYEGRDLRVATAHDATGKSYVRLLVEKTNDAEN